MDASQSAQPPLRVLIDTNVALDFLLRREPWISEAVGLLNAHAQGAVIGYMPAPTLTDIFYISRRIGGPEKAFEAIDLCLNAFELISVDRAVIDAARSLPGADFEDNVQIACALAAQLDFIITRDAVGFTHSSIPAILPRGFADRMK